MTNGIENGFILTNIFGDDFNFVNSEVEYSRSEIMAGRMSLDIIVNQNVKYPPNKWKEWEKVYVKINFFRGQRVRKCYNGNRCKWRNNNLHL